METQVGIVATDTKTLNAVLAAVQMDGVTDERFQIPQGRLGGCVACGHGVRSHFGADGRWIGCLAGDADTVYILVPASADGRMIVSGNGGNGHSATQGVTQDGAPLPSRSREREFHRARYTSTLHHRAHPDKLPLSDARKRVLAAVHAAGKTGMLARQIEKRAKLPAGAVQSTLAWLRAQALVRVSEDAKRRSAAADTAVNGTT